MRKTVLLTIRKTLIKNVFYFLFENTEKVYVDTSNTTIGRSVHKQNPALYTVICRINMYIGLPNNYGLRKTKQKDISARLVKNCTDTCIRSWHIVGLGSNGSMLTTYHHSTSTVKAQNRFCINYSEGGPSKETRV